MDKKENIEENDLGAKATIEKNTPQLLPASTVIDENTGFQVLQLNYLSGETIGNKTFTFEIDRNYSHVVGFCFEPVGSLTNTNITDCQIQTNEGIIFNKFPFNIFNRNVSNRKNIYDPVFFKAQGNSVSITTYETYTGATRDSDQVVAIFLILKNNVKNYSFEYDFLNGGSITLPAHSATPNSPFMLSFQMPSFPVNYPNCKGIMFSTQTGHQHKFVSLRKGNIPLFSDLSFLYLNNVVSNSIANNFIEKFFPLFLKNISGQITTLEIKSIKTESEAIVLTPIFLIERKSIRI